MKFTFTEKKMDVSDDLRAYAEKKIGKIDKFFKTDSDAFVTFSTERGRFRAEVTIKNNGMFYRVSELTGDMYASIDSAVASIERQIRKNKTRLEKRLYQGVSMNFDNEFVDEDVYDIIKHKKVYLKPMDAEEAILEMNMLGHTFFMFLDEESGKVCVVYKRKDGDYGLLESEML